MTDPGDLRESFRVERRAADANGDRTGAWATLIATASAEVKMLRGGEPVLAQRLEGVQPAVIRVYSWSTMRTVTTADRLVDNRSDLEWSIQAVTPTADGMWIDFLATQKQGGTGG